jgi:hypothetical protein
VLARPRIGSRGPSAHHIIISARTEGHAWRRSLISFAHRQGWARQTHLG